MKLSKVCVLFAHHFGRCVLLRQFAQFAIYASAIARICGKWRSNQVLNLRFLRNGHFATVHHFDRFVFLHHFVQFSITVSRVAENFRK
jgi:hypothetical protein